MARGTMKDNNTALTTIRIDHSLNKRLPVAKGRIIRLPIFPPCVSSVSRVDPYDQMPTKEIAAENKISPEALGFLAKVQREL